MHHFETYSTNLQVASHLHSDPFRISIYIKVETALLESDILSGLNFETKSQGLFFKKGKFDVQ